MKRTEVKVIKRGSGVKGGYLLEDGGSAIEISAYTIELRFYEGERFVARELLLNKTTGLNQAPLWMHVAVETIRRASERYFEGAITEYAATKIAALIHSRRHLKHPQITAEQLEQCIAEAAGHILRGI